jgi:alpha-tubulin suppressor-like RCC1 family protein
MFLIDDVEFDGDDKEGKIYTWGSGGHGRLGHGDTKSQLRPKLLEFPDGENLTFNHVAIGYTHSGALTCISIFPHIHSRLL